MYSFNMICILLIIGGIHAAPFLWPSSISRGTTTPPAGPPHPHAHLGHSGNFPPIMGQPYISHLQHNMQHPSNLASRPLPPLVIGAHYHHHHHPITGVAHLQGGIHHSHHRRQHNYHLTHPLA